MWDEVGWHAFARGTVEEKKWEAGIVLKEVGKVERANRLRSLCYICKQCRHFQDSFTAVGWRGGRVNNYSLFSRWRDWKATQLEVMECHKQWEASSSCPWWSPFLYLTSLLGGREDDLTCSRLCFICKALTELERVGEKEEWYIQEGGKWGARLQRDIMEPSKGHQGPQTTMNMNTW